MARNVIGRQLGMCLVSVSDAELIEAFIKRFRKLSTEGSREIVSLQNSLPSQMIMDLIKINKCLSRELSLKPVSLVWFS